MPSKLERVTFRLEDKSLGYYLRLRAIRADISVSAFLNQIIKQHQRNATRRVDKGKNDI